MITREMLPLLFPGYAGAGDLANVQVRQATGQALLDAAWAEIGAYGQHDDIPKTSLASGHATVNLHVASTSANDAAAGSGARQLAVVHLDSSFEEQTAGAISLSGVTSVQVSSASHGVVNAYVLNAGAIAGQVGEISFGVSGDFSGGGVPGTYYGKMQKDLWSTSPAPSNRADGAYFPVPAGYVAALLQVDVELENDAAIRLDIHPPSPTSAPFIPSRFLWGAQVKAPGRSYDLTAPFFGGEPAAVAFAQAVIPEQSWVVASGVQDSAGGYATVKLTYAFLRTIRP